MTLTSYGCSFIFGSDMSDAEMIPGTPGKPSKHSWPALLAKYFGRRYHCRAYPGCGNLLIAERIMLDLKQKTTQPDPFYIIGWTWIDRFDYNDPDKVDNWNTLRPNDQDDLAQIYYRNLHSEYRDKLNSLMIIKLVIDTLNQHKIPFLMTYMDDLLLDKTYNVSESVLYLQECVRPFIMDFEGTNFLSWSKKNHYPVSHSFHPLEQAHAAAAELLIKSFDKQKTNDLAQPVRA